MPSDPLGFDVEQTLDGRLIVGARSDGRLTVDGPALGPWILGRAPWPDAGPHLRVGRASDAGPRVVPAGKLTDRDTLAIHNSPYDLGSYPDGEHTPARVADSLGLSWLDDENPPHTLAALSSRKIGRSLWKPITVSRPCDAEGKPVRTAYWTDTQDQAERVLFDRVPIERADLPTVAEYCYDDATATSQLAAHYLSKLSPRLRRLYWEV